VSQRNAGLDQCATLVGRIAVLEAQFKSVSDELDEIKAELEKLKAEPSAADTQAVTVG
jgi:chaperonin cofactor prefoldin